MRDERRTPTWRPHRPYHTKRERELAAALTEYLCAHLYGAMTAAVPYGAEDFAQLLAALSAVGVRWERRPSRTEPGEEDLIVEQAWLDAVYEPRAAHYDRTRGG